MKVRFAVAATVVGASLIAAGVSAQTPASPPMQSILAGKKLTPPVKGQKPPAPTMVTYTVDISGAQLTKPGKTATTITAGDIKVDDRIAITGTLNGTSITAKHISDLGQFKGRGEFKGMPGKGPGMGFKRGMMRNHPGQVAK